MPAKFNGIVTLTVAVRVPEFNAENEHEAEWKLREKACEIASQASTVYTVHGTVIGADTDYVHVSKVETQPETIKDQATEVTT